MIVALALAIPAGAIHAEGEVTERMVYHSR